VAADGRITAVPIAANVGTKPSFEPGTPQPLFQAHVAQGPGSNTYEYDVTSDGKRFLVATTALSTAFAPTLNVVVNWDAGLK
jgi:hypothetical protein